MTPPANGTVELSGTTVRTDSLALAVNPAGSGDLPTVSLEEPEPNAAFAPTQAIALRASAEAGNGSTVAKVEFYEGSRKIGETAAPDPVSGYYELAWTPDRLGAYTLSAKVSDTAGLRDFSEGLQVRVTEGDWFAGAGQGAGNEGYAGSGGTGGVSVGVATGNAGNLGSGGNGGGASAGGGGNGYGAAAGSGSETDLDGDGLSDAFERDKLGLYKKICG